MATTAPQKATATKAQKSNNKFSAQKEAKRQERFKLRNGLGKFRQKVKSVIRKALVKNYKLKTKFEDISWSNYISHLNNLTTVHNDWLNVNFNVIKKELVSSFKS